MTSSYLAVQLRVGRLPDLAHAALTEEGGDVGVPEAGAGGQGHGSVWSFDLGMVAPEVRYLCSSARAPERIPARP